MITRTKATGFENIDHLVNELEQHLMKKYNGLPYRNEINRSLDKMTEEIYSND